MSKNSKKSKELYNLDFVKGFEALMEFEERLIDDYLKTGKKPVVYKEGQPISYGFNYKGEEVETLSLPCNSSEVMLSWQDFNPYNIKMGNMEFSGGCLSDILHMIAEEAKQSNPFDYS